MKTELKQLILKPGREKSLLRRHLWIFSGAVKTIAGEPCSGETVLVTDASGKPLATAAVSPESQLTARVWSFNPDEAIDDAFFRRRIAGALLYRRRLGLDDPSGGCRLIASEADGLPGIIVDRYGNHLVLQALSAGAEVHKKTIARELLAATGCKGVYERSDVAVRAKEGLAEQVGLLAGEEPPPMIEIRENGIRFLVDPRHGHKTGFYLDQRENRAAAAALAKGKTVLNCFCYTGGFGVAAAAGGAAMATNVDSSGPALAVARANMELNGIAADRYENIEADVFCLLRKFRAEGRKFDLIILDPPKLAESRKALPRACRAYTDMALVAFQILNPGGILMNFSCSGLMDAELFQKLTFDAALDAGVNARLFRRLQQSADHPTALNMPEGFYLKGLISQID